MYLRISVPQSPHGFALASHGDSSDFIVEPHREKSKVPSGCPESPMTRNEQGIIHMMKRYMNKEPNNKESQKRSQ